MERAFYEAGAGLRVLREKRLYRSTHRTFEDYCRDRFGFSRQNVNYLIAASTVVENILTTNGCQNSETSNYQILPTSERQVRPLTTLEADEQRQIWQEAVEQSGGKVPSGRIVKGIVERLKEKKLVSAAEFCGSDDVFTLIGLSGQERKYNGYPCVAIAVNDFTVMVEVHDATLTVKPENLNRIDSPDVHHQLPAILKRIRRLRQCDLDRGAYPILESLGRQTYLTDFEADLLAFMEQRYGIE